MERGEKETGKEREKKKRKSGRNKREREEKRRKDEKADVRGGEGGGGFVRVFLCLMSSVVISFVCSP